MTSTLRALSLGVALYICGLSPILYEKRISASDGKASAVVASDLTLASFNWFDNLFHLPSIGASSEAKRTPPPTTAAPLDRASVGSLIRAAALRNQVPEIFVKSIVAAESNFNSNAISPKGAIGLMQLMPATAREFGADPAIPEQNVEAGTRYIHRLMEKYRRRPLFYVIAAYNAGPGSVDHYHGVPPFRETRGYVTRVTAFLRHFARESANDVVLEGSILSRTLRGR